MITLLMRYIHHIGLRQQAINIHNKDFFIWINKSIEAFIQSNTKINNNHNYITNSIANLDSNPQILTTLILEAGRNSLYNDNKWLILLNIVKENNYLVVILHKEIIAWLI